MRKIINHWFDFNVIIAVAIVIMIITEKGSFDFQQRVILFEFAFCNVHFWEEYSHPGDMAGTLNVALYHNRKAPTIYPFNQVSAIICNYLFAIIIWLIPACFPHWTWSVLSAIVWGFIEFLLHLFYYPHLTRSSMSGGIVTSLVGFLPCGIIYLAFAANAGELTILNLIIAIIYPSLWYLIIFRWFGGKILATPKPKFPFTTQQLVKYVRNVKKHPIHHHEPDEF